MPKARRILNGKRRKRSSCLKQDYALRPATEQELQPKMGTPPIIGLPGKIIKLGDLAVDAYKALTSKEADEFRDSTKEIMKKKATSSNMWDKMSGKKI
jgi:hypothetical protein